MKKNTLLLITLMFCIPVCAIQAQTYEGTGRSKKVSLRKAPKYPPYLEASVSFYEPSGNKFLDAEESGRITVTVINSGKGKTEGVALSISARGDNGLIYSKAHEVGALKPRQERKINIPIRAPFTIASRAVSMTFNFSEKNGFEPDPARLTFETREFVKPVLVLVDGLDIDDSNNNGMVESGELVIITAAVQNIGQGTAKGVSVKLSKGENVYWGGESKTKFDLGSLRPGALKKFTFEVYTNKKADAIPIYAAIDESKGKFGKREQKLPLEFRKRVSKISEVQVVGIDAQSVDVALAGGFTIDVDTNIPKIGIKNKDAIAVVIGNRNYENSDVPTVDFAIRDAAVMKEYLMNIFGYKDGNIIFETDATQGKFMSIFGTRERDGKLQNYVKKGQSDVFIYYSGHGAPDPESNDGYFVPIDCDPSLVAVNGYSLNLFYEKIYDMGAKSVTVVIDACFSGSSDQGMLLKNISPVFIEVDNSVLSADNALVFTSAAGDQVSSWYPEKKHSLFTYYFLKGLKGEADQDANKLLSANELLDYLLDNVSYMARRLNNREQTPGLQTLDEEKVLIRY